MAGIAILLDLWRKNQSLNNPALFSGRAFQSTQFFSASTATAAGTSFASGAFFGCVFSLIFFDHVYVKNIVHECDFYGMSCSMCAFGQSHWFGFCETYLIKAI